MVSLTILSPEGSRSSFKATYLNFDDEVRILADIGWTGENPEDVMFFEKILGEVDMILLSHSTPEFIGGFMMLCIKFPMLMSAIPVYATLAVSQLGRVSIVEFYRSRGYLGPVDTALLEVSDVDEWFDKITSVKFFQNMTMLENRVMVTAFNSGHTLGGAFWSITKRVEKVIYAPTWNHSKDSFLNSASFLSSATGAPISSLVRPTTFITGTDLGSPVPHKKRVEKFIQLVDATLANGGAVLLPVSISGRFLELLHIIDEHLANLQGAAIPVYFLSYSGTKVLSYAANLLDWMSSQLIKEYEGIAAEDRAYSRVPFEPTKVDLISDPKELIQLPGPKIVFASGVDFRDGDISSQAMKLLCKDEKTTLILTERSPFASQDYLMASLYREWYKLAKEKGGGVAEDGVPVPLEKKISLSGWTVEENLHGRMLTAFKDRIESSRRQKLLEKVRDKRNRNILNEDDEDDDDDDDDEDEEDEEVDDGSEELPNESKHTLIGKESEGQDTNSLKNHDNSDVDAKTSTGNSSVSATSQAQKKTSSALNAHDFLVSDYISESLENNKPIDIRVTTRSRAKQSMFPFVATDRKAKFDDYGEVIDIKNFQQSDENNANNKLISDSKRKFENSDKGRWGAEFEGRSDGDKRQTANKLTPQETLNNEILQKNLDTLFNPVQRVPIRSLSRQSSLELGVRCGLSFVDLAGLVDSRSFNMIVSILRPHNLALLPNSSCLEGLDDSDGRKQLQMSFDKQREAQRKRLKTGEPTRSSGLELLAATRKQSSRAVASEMNTFFVQPNETIPIGSDGRGKFSEFEVKLDEDLTGALTWEKLDGNYRVTKVTGEIGFHESEVLNEESGLNTVQFVLKSRTNTVPSTVRTPTTKASTNSPFGPSLAIGNVRLPDLKKKLLSLNYNAEFKGEGTLVVNNVIAVRKTFQDNFGGDDTGDIIIDGQVGPLYYEVKKCITEMLAFV